jgi:anti-sigma regulatory factor (Ser/Thr protein kinase)
VRQPVSTVLDLPAGIEYLHVPGACLGALFEGDADLSARQDLTYGLQLAVYEVCANIVMHGYQLGEATAGDRAAHGDGARCRIHLVFTVAQQPPRLVIDLYDTGSSFDITQVPEPDVAEPQTRGYGLYLIRQLADEVVYEAQENSNHWQLTKAL